MRKKKLFQKTLSILTVLTLMAALTGCGSDSGNQQTSAAQENEQSSDEKSEDTNAGGDSSDPFAFDSPKDVVFPLKEKLTLTVFVNNPDQGVTTYQDNWVTDWIEEQTNIHLDYVYDLTGDEATQKLNLIMTDPDSMPDFFLRTGWTKAEVLSYGSQGFCFPWRICWKAWRTGPG